MSLVFKSCPYYCFLIFFCTITTFFLISVSRLRAQGSGRARWSLVLSVLLNKRTTGRSIVRRWTQRTTSYDSSEGGDTSPASGSARQNTASQSQSQHMSSMCHTEHRRGCTAPMKSWVISSSLGQGRCLETSRKADFFTTGSINLSF